jgi:hypothetical protein
MDSVPPAIITSAPPPRTRSAASAQPLKSRAKPVDSIRKSPPVSTQRCDSCHVHLALLPAWRSPESTSSTSRREVCHLSELPELALRDRPVWMRATYLCTLGPRVFNCGNDCGFCHGLPRMEDCLYCLPQGKTQIHSELYFLRADLGVAPFLATKMVQEVRFHTFSNSFPD